MLVKRRARALVDVERDVLLRSTDRGYRPVTGSRCTTSRVPRRWKRLIAVGRRRAPLREVAWDPQPFVEDPAVETVLHL